MRILTAFILLGALQGFITTGLLWFSQRGNRLSNRLLASLVLLISLATFNIVLMHSGVRHMNRITEGLALVVPLVIVMPIGPLIYFYIRSLIFPAKTLQKSELIHFGPVLIDLVPYATGALLLISKSFGSPGAFQQSLMVFIDEYFVYSDIPRWLSMTLYITASFRLSSRFPLSQPQATQWKDRLLFGFTAFQLIWLIHLVPYVIPPFRENLMNLVDWYPVYLPLVALIYWVGLNGFIFSLQTAKSESKRSGLSLTADQVSSAIGRLKKVMEVEKLYLDPTLNLDKIVTATGIQQKTISAVLNQHQGKSFNEFVNQYRVDALKKKLLENDSTFTIMGMALECGFNSQATMQRTFRQLTQQTPREFQLSNSSKTLQETRNDLSQIQI